MTEPARIYVEPWDRDQRLRELALVLDGFEDARHGLLEVVRAMIAGRAFSTDNNARSSAGFNAWDYGVRRLREAYRGFSDWERFEDNGVEGIINHRLKIKITVVSTDSACEKHSPRNRTPKGPATEKIVDLSLQHELFPRADVPPSDGYQFWEICVADDGNAVSAELSRPVKFQSNYFLKFSERIFLIEPDEWEKFAIATPDYDDGADFEPEVRRK